MDKVIENWDKIKDSIYRSIVFIKDEFHVKDLKGQINMAILFSKFFFELSSKKDVFNKQKEYLRQCYYICHFRNDKDTCMREKALGNYCHWIVQIAKGNFSDFTSYVEFCNYNQFTDGNVVFFDSQSSIEDCKRYPYISLMMEMEPRSFVTGKVVSLDNKTSNEKLNYHHIFPLANKGERLITYSILHYLILKVIVILVLKPRLNISNLKMKSSKTDMTCLFQLKNLTS